MTEKEIVKALREHAEWARANEWETPITLGDDLAEAADVIEKLRGAWVPVTERLPEPTVCVLAAYSSGVVEVDAWGRDGWMGENLSNGAITHWMPLPEVGGR